MANGDNVVSQSNDMRIEQTIVSTEQSDYLPDFLTPEMVAGKHLYELNDLSKLDAAIASSTSKECVWLKHWRTFLEKVPEEVRYQYLLGALKLSQTHEGESLSHIESRNIYLKMMQDFEAEALEAWRNTRWNADLSPEDEEERLPDFLTTKMVLDERLFELNDLSKLDAAIAASEDRDVIWYKHWRHNLDAVPESDRFDYLMCASTLAKKYKNKTLSSEESKRLYFDKVQEHDALMSRLQAERQARYEAGKAKAAKIRKTQKAKSDALKYTLIFLSFMCFLSAIGVFK